MKDRNDIISLPHPALRTESNTVEEFGDDLKQLIADMEAATLDWEDSREHETGVALAAIQINQPQKVIIVRRDNSDPENREFDTYINPRITRFDGEPKLELEGCLSVSDVYGYVARYPKVKIKAKNIHGKTIKLFARGFLARIFQHEIDHIHGITFVDKLGPNAKYFQIKDDEMQPMTAEKTKQLMKEYQVDGKVRTADNDNE